MLLRYSSNPDIQEKLNCYLLLIYIPHFLFKLSDLHFDRFKVMVINATFNNISVISRRSVLFMEETTNLPNAISVVSGTPRHELDSNSQC